MTTDELLKLKAEILSLQRRLVEVDVKRQGLFEDMKALSLTPLTIVRRIKEQQAAIDTMTIQLSEQTDKILESVKELQEDGASE